MLFDRYDHEDFFDELLLADGRPRPEAELLVGKLQSFSADDLRRRQLTAERLLLQMGITFNVYGDSAGTERIFPFDIVPRIVAASEWTRIERGLKQRVRALNAFIDDIYHEQHIIKDGVVPAEIILTAKSFRQACVGLHPPRGIWCHITGTDLVRDRDGHYRRMQGRARPIRAASGEVIRWIGTWTDVEDDRLLRDQLKSSQRQLSER